MEISKLISFPQFGNRHTQYDEPSTCPLCKHSIKPVELSNHPFCDEEKHLFLSFTYLCKHCYQTFIVLHKASTADHTVTCSTRLLYIEPNRFTEQAFDQSVSNLSPQFVKIYNQALAAECAKLDELAGLGYRKALEFLTKDFCIYLHPDDAEKIKGFPLSKCIASYVDDPRIKTLAERSAWIGNDEAHYIRKQADRDVDDMKAFIKAMVYFVSMVLITEDAASMSPA